MTARPSTKRMKTRWPVTSGHGLGGFAAQHRRPEVGGHLGYSGLVANDYFQGRIILNL